jgi:hypothetical protein
MAFGDPSILSVHHGLDLLKRTLTKIIRFRKSIIWDNKDICPKLIKCVPSDSLLDSRDTLAILVGPQQTCLSESSSSTPCHDGAKSHKHKACRDSGVSGDGHRHMERAFPFCYSLSSPVAEPNLQFRTWPNLIFSSAPWGCFCKSVH